MSQALRRMSQERRTPKRVSPFPPRRQLPRSPTWRPAQLPKTPARLPLFNPPPGPKPGTFGRLMPPLAVPPSVSPMFPYWRWMLPRLIPWLSWGLLGWELWKWYQDQKQGVIIPPDPALYHFCNPDGTRPKKWVWFPFNHCSASFSDGFPNWAPGRPYLHKREYLINNDPFNAAREYYGPYLTDPGFELPTVPEVSPPLPSIVEPAPYYPPMPTPDPRLPWAPFRQWDPEIYPPGLPVFEPPLPLPWEVVPNRPGVPPYETTKTRQQVNEPGVSWSPSEGVKPTAPHVVARPAPRTKERKVRDGTSNKFWLRAFKSAQKQFHRLTEAGDLIDSWYEALPKKYQTCKPRTPQCMMMQIYDNAEHLDIGQALLNMAYNEVEDRVAGKFFGQLDKSARKLGSHGYKFELPTLGRI